MKTKMHAQSNTPHMFQLQKATMRTEEGASWGRNDASLLLLRSLLACWTMLCSAPTIRAKAWKLVWVLKSYTTSLLLLARDPAPCYCYCWHVRQPQRTINILTFAYLCRSRVDVSRRVSEHKNMYVFTHAGVATKRVRVSTDTRYWVMHARDHANACMWGVRNQNSWNWLSTKHQTTIKSMSTSSDRLTALRPLSRCICLTANNIKAYAHARHGNAHEHTIWGSCCEYLHLCMTNKRWAGRRRKGDGARKTMIQTPTHKQTYNGRQIGRRAHLPFRGTRYLIFFWRPSFAANKLHK